MRLFLTSLFFVSVLTSAGAFCLDLPESPIDLAMRAGLQESSQLAYMDRPFKTEGETTTSENSFQRTHTGGKSLFKAALLSAIVPGGGQFYVGSKKKARYFLATELVTWVGYAAFKTYGNWREDDYVRYAAVHANAQIEGKTEEFVDLVGFYTDIHEYNTLGRAFDPEREFLPDTPENHWQWKSIDERHSFRDLKNRSREAGRRAEFMLGIAIVDRVISIVDAVRGARKANSRIDGSFSSTGQPTYKFSVNPFSSRNQFKLTIFADL